MLFQKRIYTIFIFSVLTISTAVSQVNASEEYMPYDMSDGNLSLVYSRNQSFVYEDYTLARSSPAQAGQTQSIEARGVNEKIYSGFGVGLDMRFALLYALFSKNKSRLRIGDDFGLGCFMASNHQKVKDAL